MPLSEQIKGINQSPWCKQLLQWEREITPFPRVQIPFHSPFVTPFPKPVPGFAAKQEKQEL